MLRSSVFVFERFVFETTGGHGGLRYCGIELVFKRYFGNFDFNVRYCGII